MLLEAISRFRLYLFLLLLQKGNQLYQGYVSNTKKTLIFTISKYNFNFNKSHFTLSCHFDQREKSQDQAGYKQLKKRRKFTDKTDQESSVLPFQHLQQTESPRYRQYSYNHKQTVPVSVHH